MLTFTASFVDTGPGEILRWGHLPLPRLTPGPVDTQVRILHWEWFEIPPVNSGASTKPYENIQGMISKSR